MSQENKNTTPGGTPNGAHILPSPELAGELEKRILELNCLYGVSRILEDRSLPLGEIIRRTVELLPGSPAYPAPACSLIDIDGSIRATGCSAECTAIYSAPIRVNGMCRGCVEISFHTDANITHPELNVADLKSLIDTVAERLGRAAEKIEIEHEVGMFMKLSNSASYGVAFMNMRGHLTYVNPYFANIHGFETNQVLGKHITMFHSLEQMDLVLNLFDEAVASGSLSGVEVPHAHRDGREFPMLMNIAVIRGENGEPLATAATAMDIAEIKDYQDEILRHREHLEHLVEQRTAEITRATDDLKRNEGFLSDIFDSIQDGLCVLDTDGAIIKANATLENLHSDIAPLTGKKCHGAFCAAWDSGDCTSQLTLADGKPHSATVLRSTALHAEPRWFEVHSYPLKDRSSGALAGVIEYSRDITNRIKGQEELAAYKNKLEELVAERTSQLETALDESKRIQADLRESERRLTEAHDMARMGVWELDIVNDVLSWSPGIYRIFEVDPLTFGATYEAFISFVHPDDRDFVNNAYTSSLENKTPYDITHRLLMPDGRVKYMREVCRTDYDATGRPLRSLGSVQDVTEIKQAEEKLKNQAETLEHLVARRTGELTAVNAALIESEATHRALAHRLISVGEEERSHLSRELHDQMGKTLTGLAFNIEYVKSRTGKNEPSDFDNLSSMVETASNDLRRICKGLRPPVLDDMGLLPALDALCRDFESFSGLTVAADLAGIKKARLQGECAISAYRILQESLTNIMRHAKAANVSVSARASGGMLILDVTDDGTGFDEQRGDHGRNFGLIGMRERAELCGGHVEIISSLGNGTRVIMRLPLQEE